MSVLRYSFFILPIHHYSYKEYRQRNDEYVEKRKIDFSRYSPQPFDQLSKDAQTSMEYSWLWPPWKYNDIVGFLEIGVDIGNELTADIYLMQKYFPRDLPHRARPREITYFAEVAKVPVRGRDNEAYLRALDGIIAGAIRIIRKRNRRFKLYIPSYGWGCVDLVKIHKQVRKLDRLE